MDGPLTPRAGLGVEAPAPPWDTIAVVRLNPAGHPPAPHKEISVTVVGYILLGIHIVCSLGMIVFVLLHSGKGTGVSSLFGAGLPASATGTGIIEKNLDRITIGFATGYGLSAVLLMLTYRPSM